MTKTYAFEHVKEAEKLLESAKRHWANATPHNSYAALATFETSLAQVHATLAIASRFMVVTS